MGSGQDMIDYGFALTNIPKIKADQQLRDFRQEAQLSWDAFNSLWTELCHYLNSPANDILLNNELVGTSGYDRVLWTITSDILVSGVFGDDRRGTWRYGKYENEEDISS